MSDAKTMLELNPKARDAVHRSMEAYAAKVRAHAAEVERRKAAATEFVDVALKTLKVFADAISQEDGNSAEVEGDRSGAPRCALALRKVSEQKMDPSPLCAFSVGDHETVVVSWEHTATPRGDLPEAKLPRSREWIAEEVQAFLAALG